MGVIIIQFSVLCFLHVPAQLSEFNSEKNMDIVMGDLESCTRPFSVSLVSFEISVKTSTLGYDLLLSKSDFLAFVECYDRYQKRNGV